MPPRVVPHVHRDEGSEPFPTELLVHGDAPRIEDVERAAPDGERCLVAIREERRDRVEEHGLVTADRPIRPPLQPPRHRAQMRPAPRDGRRTGQPTSPPDTSRPSDGESGAIRWAASSSVRGASLPRVETKPICARRSSTRARSSSSSASRSVAERSARASSRAAARTLVWAATSIRCARRTGSGVSVADQSRKAAAAAKPPRACARAADRSNSKATSSSGADVAWARCQARRSRSTF